MLAIQILVVASACTRRVSIEQKIVALIEAQCLDKTPCRIRIDQATPFKWDRIYVFKYTATQPDRDGVLGVKDQGYREMERQLVFMHDGKIAHEESEPTNVEHLLKNELVFDIPDNSFYKSYPSDTFFAVTKLESEDGRYYRLNVSK